MIRQSEIIIGLLEKKPMSANQIAEVLGVEKTSPVSRAWTILGSTLDELRSEGLVGLAIDTSAPKLEEARSVGPDSYVYYLKDNESEMVLKGRYLLP